ncbi:AAA family ATPase [Curtobacterium flaccumfaciens pv. flaccumfaciens]|uniref:AAA family ATPase n=1 Tax=Curtobacterium flaccumfaciens TaxID=2035 RepID=UPI001BCE5148|nr:AAA family ATPase [Curtobacterium flaccumfaciens]QVG66540.1 AAA family ATPase [Curtobacterium flaccumfaciens pv. flaccumfaciens]
MTLNTVPVQQRRLIRVEVSGVLGEYEHEFDFGDAGEFVIIYGPNGVGKTRVLEIIDALSDVSVSKLVALPFSTAALFYSDGSALRVGKVPAVADDDSEVEVGPDREDLRFELSLADGTQRVSQVNASADFNTWLSRMTPWQSIDNSNLWQSEIDGEITFFSDLRSRYFPRFRAELRRQGEVPTRKEIDPDITDFAGDLRVKLIETQRLTVAQLGGEKRRFGTSESQRNVPTISQNSEQIKQQLDGNLSANSRLTQSLDSTFPRRMLERGSQSVLTEAELRNKWAEQTTRRARLTQIADLNVDPQLSLPDAELNPWQLSMLELYLEDADRKLASFSEILAKIDLLEEVVNTRLLGKRLHIDANNGLLVSRTRDRSSIPLTALSSGEQHEIILMFDLLFNVAPGSVVLIDEPEISLHIGWQKKFIADVIRVAALVGFQFCVATHSPQIIDRWWSSAHRLGPTSTEFLGDEPTDLPGGEVAG